VDSINPKVRFVVDRIFAFVLGVVLGAVCVLVLHNCCSDCAKCEPAKCSPACPPDCGPRLEKLERVVFKTGAEQPE